jgi:hypothetical protein
MADEKETPTPAPSGRSKEEIALDLTKFVASVAGYGKVSGSAGFGAKESKGPDEVAQQILELYGRCRKAIG